MRCHAQPRCANPNPRPIPVSSAVPSATLLPPLSFFLGVLRLNLITGISRWRTPNQPLNDPRNRPGPEDWGRPEFRADPIESPASG